MNKIPFDINKLGDPRYRVVTRDERPINQLIKFEELATDFRLKGALEGCLESWRIDGKYLNSRREDKNDLFMIDTDPVPEDKFDWKAKLLIEWAKVYAAISSEPCTTQNMPGRVLEWIHQHDVQAPVPESTVKWVSIVHDKDEKIKELESKLQGYMTCAEINNRDQKIGKLENTIIKYEQTIRRYEKSIEQLNNDITNLQSVVEGQNKFIEEKDQQIHARIKVTQILWNALCAIANNGPTVPMGGFTKMANEALDEASRVKVGAVPETVGKATADLARTITLREQTIRMCNEKISDLQHELAGAQGKAEAQDDVIKDLHTKLTEARDMLDKWNKVADEAVLKGCYEYGETPERVLVWIREMKVALADKTKTWSAKEIDRLDNVINERDKELEGLYKELNELKRKHLPSYWFDATKQFPPKKQGQDFSDSCIVQYSDSTYGIAYYHYAPPFSVPHWVDYYKYGALPVRWQRITPPSQPGTA